MRIYIYIHAHIYTERKGDTERYIHRAGTAPPVLARFFVFTKPDPTVQALLFSGRAEEGGRFTLGSVLC